MESILKPATRDEIRALVKEIITSIKPLDEGVEDIPDDAPLFDDGSGEPSPVGLDSLDTLDLALAIGDRFELDAERFDLLTNGEVELEALRTVNDIVDFVVSILPRSIANESGTVP